MSQTAEAPACAPAEFPRAAGLRRDVSARTLTTFGIGGPIRALFEPQNLDAARELISRFAASEQTWRVLGAGSNLLVADQGIAEPVLRLGRSFTAHALLSPEESSPRTLDELWRRAAADSRAAGGEASQRCVVLGGASLMTLCRELSGRGLSGLEFSAGIPASLGGAVVMNAGAHGNQLSEIVQTVFALGPNGEDLILSKDQLNYSYRHSELPRGALVVGAEIELRREELEIVRKRRTECLDYRKQTQPLTLPSAGSAFRNPSRTDLHPDTIQDVPAAAVLLERCGLKGFRRGGVAYSELHSNWLVRVSDEALAADAHALFELGISRVLQESSITLRPEIVFWE